MFLKKIPLAAATLVFFVVRCKDYNLAQVNFPLMMILPALKLIRRRVHAPGSRLEAVSGPRQLFYRQLHLF